MKPSLVIVSLIVLVSLAIEVHRAPGGAVTRWASAFIAAQAMLTAISLVAFWRSGLSSMIYFRVFYGALAVATIFAVILSVQFLRSFPSFLYAAFFVYSAASFVGSACGVFVLSLRRANMLTIFSGAHVLCSSVLLLCGICGLVSLAFPAKLHEDAIRLCVSLFWTLVGGYGLSEAGFYLRARADIVSRLAMTPTVIAIVLFSLLALSLRSQREASRQATPETVRLDARIAAYAVARKAE
jgi:hypothetical protein